MPNAFDIDGVIYMGEGKTGVFPGPNDVIITGRSYEERDETIKMLEDRGIDNIVFFNPLCFDAKNRKTSGEHKANILKSLKRVGLTIDLFFEDDPIQIKEIKEGAPWVKIVHLDHDGLVDK